MGGIHCAWYKCHNLHGGFLFFNSAEMGSVWVDAPGKNKYIKKKKWNTGKTSGWHLLRQRIIKLSCCDQMYHVLCNLLDVFWRAFYFLHLTLKSGTRAKPCNLWSYFESLVVTYHCKKLVNSYNIKLELLGISRDWMGPCISGLFFHYLHDNTWNYSWEYPCWNCSAGSNTDRRLIGINTAPFPGCSRRVLNETEKLDMSCTNRS